MALNRLVVAMQHGECAAVSRGQRTAVATYLNLDIPPRQVLCADRSPYITHPGTARPILLSGNLPAAPALLPSVKL
jgi:hypothetical protein